jgi:hypothetical protein
MARPDKRIESHSTLRLIIDNGDILRVWYLASAELTIDGVEYEPELRKSSRIKSSLTRAADSGSVEIQNVDTEIGREFLAQREAIYGAEAKIGRWWRDSISGWEGHKVFLTGPVVGFDLDENIVRLRAVSEPYANISVGARRIIDPLCQAVFRDPTTCGFAGAELTCNLMLNHAGGCKGRHGQTPTLERAKFMGDPYVNAASRFKTS